MSVQLPLPRPLSDVAEAESLLRPADQPATGETWIGAGEALRPDPLSETWISSAQAAGLLGITPRAVRKQCAEGKIEFRYAIGDRGGRRLEVRVESLPIEAQQRRQSREPRAESRDQKTGLTPAERWDWARGVDRGLAIYRKEALDAWREFGRTAPVLQSMEARTAGFLAAWGPAHPEDRLSGSTLYRWAAGYRADGVAGLLPEYMTGSKDAALPEALRERFHQLYMTQHRRSVATCRDLLFGELVSARSDLADALPSIASFQRYVRTIPMQARILARDGGDAYRRKCQPFLRRDYTQYHVMERWVSDHYLMKFWVYHEGRVFRPWLTVWMDLRSRYIVGWLVHEGPTQETVLAPLAEGVLRCGAPAELYTDNGLEFSSPTLAGKSRRWRVRLDEPRMRALTEHLQATWHFSLPRQPQSRGMIERWFGVTLERFDKLQLSFCGRDVAEKPDDLNALLKTPRALPSLAKIREQFGVYVTEVANVTPSEGQGMDGRSPAEVFASEPYIKRTATPEALKLLFTRARDPITVGQNGIHVFDRDYGRIELAPHFGTKVWYRCRPDNIGELYVFSFPEERYLCTVRRSDAAGVSEEEYRRIAHDRKALKAAAKSYQAKREAHAADPDPVASLAAARRARNENRESRVESRDRAAGPQKIERVATAMEFAAKEITADRKRARHLAVVQRAADETLGDLAPALAGARKPTRDELADQAFAELAG